MTARTFRDQSPARGGSATSNLDVMIPVPPLPRGYAASPPQRPRNSELPGVQGLPPSTSNGAAAAAAIAGRRARSVSSLSLGPADLERGGSRNSINFSYPMNRPNSPRLSIASLDSPRRNGPSSPRAPQQQQQKTSVKQAPVTPTDKPATSKPPLSESRPTLVDQATQVADNSFDETPSSPPGQQQTDNKQGVRETVAKPSSTVSGGTQTDNHEDIRHASPPPILARRPSTVLELHEEVEDEQPSKQPLNLGLGFTKHRQPAEPIRLKEPPPVQQIKSRETQQVQPRGSAAPPPPNIFHIRPHSVSPNRLTRFSEHLNIPESEKNLHIPPPRSLSPAKPALKSTPSPSPTIRPERLAYQPGQPGSETSEGTSLVSDDGSRAGSKKRHPKVSFEDETEVIGHGISPPTSPESLTSSSPRTHTPSRSWSDSLIRSKLNDDDSNDFEQFFAPRPALPSFGSIRGRKPSRSKDIENDSNPPAMEITPSSADHAIGEIDSSVGGRNQSKHDANPNLSLPPEVTSLESTGYSSLSDDSSSDEGTELRYFPSHLDSRKDISTSRNTSNQANGTSQPRQTEVTNNLKPTPAIFIQPATPAMEEVAHSKQSPPEMPNDESPRGVNSYFSGNDTKPQRREEKDDDSDSGNSVYSDAYEDLSDMEGDGFGSIDAIVDKSVASVPEPQQPSTLHSLSQESDQRKKPNDSVETPVPSDAVLETQSQSAPQHQPEGTTEGESRRKAPSTPAPIKITDKPLFEENPTSPPITSSYTSSNAGCPGQFNRHSPALRPILESHGSSEKKPVKTNGKAAPVHRPQRTMSNASDSSSSFKRPKRVRSTGRYTLRRTMRASSPDHGLEVLSDGGLPPKPFDYSPNHRPSSSNDSRPMMRTTLRQSPNATTSRFSVFTSRGKSTKTNGSSAKPRPFKSRYVESSDEEAEAIKLRPVRGIPRKKNEADGDSTDLDDSSENETTKNVLRRKKSNKIDSRGIQDPAVAAAVARLMAPRDIEQSAAVSVIPGPEHLPEFNVKHRSGFLGRLHLPKHRLRNRESILRKPDTVFAFEQSRLGLDPATIPSPTLPQDDHSRSTTITAVNGRVLERSGSDWQAISPKLQKRASKLIHRPAGDSWPLRSNGHTAFSLPSSPTMTEGRRPTVLPVQDITNGKDSNARPRTADSVAAQNTTQHINASSTPNSPSSPARAERPLWTSRFRPSRRGTDENSTTSAISDVHLSSLRMEVPRREKKGRFPKLKKVFGIS